MALFARYADQISTKKLLSMAIKGYTHLKVRLNVTKWPNCNLSGPVGTFLELVNWTHINDPRPLVTAITGNPNAVLANRRIRCIYAVLANKIIRCIYLCSFVFMSRLALEGISIRSETVNAAGYQMRLLVWCVVSKTLKFRLTFRILSC